MKHAGVLNSYSADARRANGSQSLCPISVKPCASLAVFLPCGVQAWSTCLFYKGAKCAIGNTKADLYNLVDLK